MAGRLRNPRNTVRGAISITCGYVPASIVPFPFPPHTPTSFCHKRHPLRHKRQPLHFFAINGSLRSRAPQTAASAAERCKRRSPHLQKILIGRLTKKREQPPPRSQHTKKEEKGAWRLSPSGYCSSWAVVTFTAPPPSSRIPWGERSMLFSILYWTRTDYEGRTGRASPCFLPAASPCFLRLWPWRFL